MRKPYPVLRGCAHLRRFVTNFDWWLSCRRTVGKGLNGQGDKNAIANCRTLSNTETEYGWLCPLVEFEKEGEVANVATQENPQLGGLAFKH